MADESVLCEVADGIATVTLNRPRKLNALDRATLIELGARIDELAARREVHVVILTGAGDRAFVAGADIEEMSRLAPAEALEFSRLGQRVFDRIEGLGKPVLAAINGFALGGGCELALAATVRLASDSAEFGQPEVKLGLIPGFGGTQRLARLLGRSRALEIILTGRRVRAEEALALGLVSRVLPAASLLPEARALAATIAAQAPLAVAYALQSVTHGLESSQADGQALEASLFGLTFATEDMREGTRAFLDKRPAQFRGR